jgi:hypothetical protein
VEVTIHICTVFGYDLLCDLLEILNFNKYRSAIATRRNLVDPIQSRNISGRIPMETFSILFFQFIFILFSSIDICWYLIPVRIVYIPQMNPCRAHRDPCRRQACIYSQGAPNEPCRQWGLFFTRNQSCDVHPSSFLKQRLYACASRSRDLRWKPGNQMLDVSTILDQGRNGSEGIAK